VHVDFWKEGGGWEAGTNAETRGPHGFVKALPEQSRSHSGNTNDPIMHGWSRPSSKRLPDFSIAEGVPHTPIEPLLTILRLVAGLPSGSRPDPLAMPMHPRNTPGPAYGGRLHGSVWARFFPAAPLLSGTFILVAPSFAQEPAALRVAESAGADGLRVAIPPIPLAETADFIPGSDGVVQGITGPTPRTLPEFIAYAERSHPRLQGARAAIEAARGKAVQARLYPNPMLAGSSPQIAGANSQWNGYATQDIVTAGKLRLAQQAALRDVQRTEYDYIRARFEVLTSVRDAFYRLLVSQRRMAIFKLLVDITTRSYEIGKQLADAGEGTKADVLFWSIERDRAAVRLLNGGVFVEAGRRELAAAMGLSRADVGLVEADMTAQLPDFDLKLLQAAVAERNARPQAALAGVSRAQWALERAVVEPIPDINIMGGYQRQVDFPPQDQGLMQVMVEVPLFDRNQGNIRAARADIASARADLRTIELDLATEAAQQLASYRTAQRLVGWYEQDILPKARETVALTQTLYGRGEVTFLSLLQAQRILTETELVYVDTQETRWRAAVQIADLLQLENFPPESTAPAARENLVPNEIANPNQLPWAQLPVGQPAADQGPVVPPAAGGGPVQPLPAP
jgi:cobalt-zinc-cadmium efflux system outer membrane protein